MAINLPVETLMMLLAACVALALGLLVIVIMQRKERLRVEQELQRERDELQALEIKQEQERERQQQAILQVQMELSGAKERLSNLAQTEQELLQREQELKQLNQDYSALHADNQSLRTRLEMAQQAHADKLQTLEEARQQLQHEFAQLAQKIFEDNSQRFGTQQQEKLQNMLQPVRQQIDDFKKRVDDVYDKEAKDRRGLFEQIEQLKTLNMQMSEDAINLTNALKSETKTQGNWGELVLARLLEQSGLRDGHEYKLQYSARSEEGKLYQPDVIIFLPDNKQIILDSKVSLLHYEQYCSSAEGGDRQKALKAHGVSVRRHIDGLSQKDYQHLPELTSLDFVLMFIPIDSAFMLALEQDSGLFNYAFERNILLVSPSTLLVTLRTINHIWRNEKQSQHAQEIARKAAGLYDKFVGFVDALEEVGRYLQQATTSYDKARNRLVEGRGNLVSRVAELQTLGINSKKKLEAQLTEKAKVEDESE